MKKTLKTAALFLVVALIGGIGIYVGFFLASDISSSEFQEKLATVNGFFLAEVVLVSIVLVIFSFFLQIILHEGGHLVCGLASGYRFVSFRILNLTIIRQDGQFRIKRFGIAGTEGQCLLLPPDRPLREIPTAWYNLGGVIANLLTAIIALILLLTINEMPYPLRLLLFFTCLFGSFLALTNGIPMEIGGIGNDAENMRLLQRNENSKRAMLMQLRINALIQEGVRPKDMPEEWFRQDEEVNYKDALQVAVSLMAASRFQDLEEWDAAYTTLEEIMKHKDEILGTYVKEVACELLFTSLIKGMNEQAVQLYTNELKSYINKYKKVMSAKQRTLCAIALYQEKDAPKAREIYETVCRRKEDYLMQGEVNMDVALMKSFLTAEGVL